MLEIYHGPDNIYWLFSSSAQSIAAFIGFLAAGFFFIHDRLDRQIEADETLDEINTEIKRQYFQRLRLLLWFTGLSICLSLVVVYLNGYNLGYWNDLIRLLVAILNTLTIFITISFVLFIIDPEKVKRTASKLIRENEGVTEGDEANTIDPREYMAKFIPLEQLLRAIYIREQPVTREPWEQSYRNHVPLGKVIRYLFEKGIISGQQYDSIASVSRIRNLAAHGQNTEIEMGFANLVDSLYMDLRNRFPEVQ